MSPRTRIAPPVGARHHHRHEPRLAARPAARGVPRRGLRRGRRLRSRAARGRPRGEGHSSSPSRPCHPRHGAASRRAGVGRALPPVPLLRSRHRAHAQPQAWCVRASGRPGGACSGGGQHGARPLRAARRSARQACVRLLARARGGDLLRRRVAAERRGSARARASPGASSQAARARQRHRPQPLRSQPARCRTPRQGAGRARPGSHRRRRGRRRPAGRGEGLRRTARCLRPGAGRAPRGRLGDRGAVRPVEGRCPLTRGDRRRRARARRALPRRARRRGRSLRRHGHLRAGLASGGLPPLGHGGGRHGPAPRGHRHPRMPPGGRPGGHRHARAAGRRRRVGRRPWVSWWPMQICAAGWVQVARPRPGASSTSND